MSDIETKPRWEILNLRPTEDRKEALFGMNVHAPDVQAWELVYALSRVLTHFAATPGARLQTVEEREAMQAEAAGIAAHPATRLLVKSGKQLWLGEGAPVERLVEAGWVDAGPVPEVVRRACDWATDPGGFEARHFPVRVPGKVLELVANDVHDVEEDAPS